MICAKPLFAARPDHGSPKSAATPPASICVRPKTWRRNDFVPEFAYMTKIAMSGAEARPRARPAIFDIDPYVPGQSAAPGAANIFKLSANETPLGPSPRAREAFRAFADRLQNYPDGAATALREALGAKHGLDPA